jgi:galactose-3-O-sulfotransferase
MSQSSGRRAATQVIFMHLSKTAGTTLRQIILAQYGSDAVRHVDGCSPSEPAEHVRRLPASERDGIRAFVGHMAFGLHRVLSGPSTYVTLVRDPVERLISHYHYSLSDVTAPLHGEVVSKGMTLKDYVERSEAAWEFNDGQTRLLGCDMLRWPCASSTDLLERAKRNIEERFAVVGTTERFDESVLLMRRALGWDWPLYRSAKVAHDRPRKEDVTDDALRAIVARNELDAELHRYVTERFDRVIAESESELPLADELERFRLLNARAESPRAGDRLDLGRPQATEGRRG